MWIFSNALPFPSLPFNINITSHNGFIIKIKINTKCILNMLIYTPLNPLPHIFTISSLSRIKLPSLFFFRYTRLFESIDFDRIVDVLDFISLKQTILFRVGSKLNDKECSSWLINKYISYSTLIILSSLWSLMRYR